MNALRQSCGWVCRLTALPALALLFTTACATTTTVVVATPPPPAPQVEDDDFSELIAQLRADLSRFNARHVEKSPSVSATAGTKK